MLEPGAPATFFRQFFVWPKWFSSLKNNFLFVVLLLLFGAPATFWSSCWVLAYGGGSSVRRPLLWKRWNSQTLLLSQFLTVNYNHNSTKNHVFATKTAEDPSPSSFNHTNGCQSVSQICLKAKQLKWQEGGHTTAKSTTENRRSVHVAWRGERQRLKHKHRQRKDATKRCKIKTKPYCTMCKPYWNHAKPLTKHDCLTFIAILMMWCKY